MAGWFPNMFRRESVKKPELSRPGRFSHAHGGLTPAALVAPACDGGDGLNGEGTIPQPPIVCMVRDGLRKRALLI